MQPAQTSLQPRRRQTAAAAAAAAVFEEVAAAAAAAVEGPPYVPDFLPPAHAVYFPSLPGCLSCTVRISSSVSFTIAADPSAAWIACESWEACTSFENNGTVLFLACCH